MSLEKFPTFFLNSSETDLNRQSGQIYRFRSFRLDVTERRLLNEGAPVALTPKAFDVLALLVQRSGHLIEKNELINAVWPETVVEETNLSRVVHTLRKLLGESRSGNKFIETVATKGYRFVAEVTVEEAEPADEDGKNAQSFAVVNQISEENKDDAVEPKISSASLSSRFAVVTVIVLVLVVSMAASWRFLSLRSDGSNSAKLIQETMSGEALQSYTQGKFLVERRHKGDYLQALVHFDRAIELDPNYANAYAGKADVKVIQFWGSSAHEDIIQARSAVRRAIELDRSNSYARTVLCRILTTYEWDHRGAEKECRRAVEINPNDHEAQKELGFLLNSLGHDEEAIEAIDKAIALAPTSFNKRSRGLILYHSRRYDEAIAQFEQVEETDPGYNETSRWLMLAYQMKKDYAKAFESYRRTLEESGTPADEIALLTRQFEKEGWQAVQQHIVGNPGKRTMFLASAYAQLGETDKAIEALEDMFKRRAVLLITSAREPALDPIRDDPRFKDLLQRIGLK